ncbi:MAG: serine hydrolase domain-containing protein [Gammaproteobacteria bacterium]
MPVSDRFSLLRCRIPQDLDSVTTRRARAEVAPHDLGLAADATDRIWSRAEDLYRTGMNPGIALCVRYRGQVVLDRAIGHARGNAPMDPEWTEKELLTPDTPVCLFSASKAVTAMLVHKLAEEGKLNLLDPIAEYIPEFANNGKENTTIQHLLSHRGGVPRLEGEVDPSLLFDHDAVTRMLCNARPVSPGGRRLAYHAITAGFILAELVERVEGRSIREVQREKVQRPMGMRWFNFGVDADDMDQIALNAMTGLRPMFPVDRYIRHILGGDYETAIEISNDPRWLQAIIPAGNIYATADESCRFFEMMRRGGELDGARIFDPRTIRRAVMETGGPELDRTLMVPMRFSMGLMLGSKPFGLMGPSTEQAYGHLGFVNVMCWADPERELSASLLTTGKPLVGPHFLPWGKLVWEIARQFPETSLRK